ncbi:MAG: hypothetical protein EBS84_00290 [Proteobacteria bacterium]|nr:hypothetical protein [Pseudomonadota bacterium]
MTTDQVPPNQPAFTGLSTTSGFAPAFFPRNSMRSRGLAAVPGALHSTSKRTLLISAGALRRCA